MRRSAVVMLLTLVVTAAGSVPPAGATTHVVETFDVNVSDIDRTTCRFRIRFTFAGTARLTGRFDDSGAMVSQTLHVNLIETDTNVKTGTSITSRQNENDFFNAEAGVLRLVGLIFQFNVPGSGSVLTDAGLLVFGADGGVEFVTGPHEFLDGDVAAYCSALSYGHGESSGG